MKNSLLRLMCGVCLYAASATDASSQTSAECLSLVRSVYKTMQVMSSGESPCYSKYTITSTGIVNKVLKSQTTPIEMVATKYRMQLITPQIESYQDTVFAVSIIPRLKRIYISRNYRGQDAEQKLTKFMEFQDSLLGTCTVESCRSTDGGATKTIKLLYSKNASTLWKISSATLVIDLKKQLLKRMTVAYLNTSQIRQMDYVIDAFIPHYTGAWFEGSPIDCVYSPSRQLKPKYAGYKVITATPRH